MKISDVALDTFRSAAYAWSRNSHIEFCNMADCFSHDLKLGVNWAAIGTVDAETTATFADNLGVAACIVEMLNAEHYTIDREADDPEIIDAESEDKARAFLLEQLNLCRPYAILRWFIAHAID